MTNKLKNFKDELVNNINQASQVFVVGHHTPDYDAIGAAIGIATLTKVLKKPVYIIVNDPRQTLDQGVQKIIEETETTYHYINLEEFRNYADKNSLLITVDVNKQYLTCVQDDLDKVGKIMIIDHHQENLQTSIKTEEKNKFIDENTTSTCEIVTELLSKAKINYSKEVAKYLLTGIVLDTKRFEKITSPLTFCIAGKLIKKGADYDKIINLFKANYDEDNKISTLMFDKKKIYDSSIGDSIKLYDTYTIKYKNLTDEPSISFTVRRDKPNKIYSQEELAKAADRLLNYSSACIVLGKVSESEVGISARSECKSIDVGKILGLLEKADFTLNQEMSSTKTIIKSGGGNKRMAGGKVTTDDVFAVEKFLRQAVDDALTDEIEKQDKPIQFVKNKTHVTK